MPRRVGALLPASPRLGTSSTIGCAASAGATEASYSWTAIRDKSRAIAHLDTGVTRGPNPDNPDTGCPGHPNLLRGPVVEEVPLVGRAGAPDVTARWKYIEGCPMPRGLARIRCTRNSASRATRFRARCCPCCSLHALLQAYWDSGFVSATGAAARRGRSNGAPRNAVLFTSTRAALRESRWPISTPDAGADRDSRRRSASRTI